MFIDKIKYDSGDGPIRVKPYFEAQIYCECGAPANYGYKYCPTCGRRLKVNGTVSINFEAVVPMIREMLEQKLAEEIEKETKRKRRPRRAMQG